MKELIFSPSEFAFGYSGCKRCYYDLKKDNLRISTAFPSIFSKLDRLQKEFYHDQNTDVLSANIESGKIKTDYEKLQKSQTLKDKKGREFILRGKIDAYIDHGTFYSIIDFKVTDINEKKIELYKTQLLSYAIMFEKPNEKCLKLTPIKNLGIFCFEPEKIQSVNSNPSFNMKTQYYPIQRDDDYLLSFITEIIDFLEGPKPTFDEKCGLCNLKKNNFN